MCRKPRLEELNRWEEWGKEPEIFGDIKADYKGVKISGKIESELGDYKDYFINLRDAINGKQN